jgi:hypothetical protein
MSINLPLRRIFPSGWALATVFVNGTPSAAGILLLATARAEIFDSRTVMLRI